MLTLHYTVCGAFFSGCCPKQLIRSVGQVPAEKCEDLFYFMKCYSKPPLAALFIETVVDG